jgi:hypothetical protein
MLLQTEGDERLDLFATRVQFDELITMFSNMKRHLSDDSTTIHNSVFERTIVKLQGGCEKDLTATENGKLDGSKLPKTMTKKRLQLKVSQGTKRRCCWMSTVESEPGCCNRTSIA